MKQEVHMMPFWGTEAKTPTVTMELNVKNPGLWHCIAGEPVLEASGLDHLLVMSPVAWRKFAEDRLGWSELQGEGTNDRL